MEKLFLFVDMLRIIFRLYQPEKNNKIENSLLQFYKNQDTNFLSHPLKLFNFIENIFLVF